MNQNSRIYVNDGLTKRNSEIKKKSLILLKSKSINKVKYGIVYVKSTGNDKFVQINNLADLSGTSTDDKSIDYKL